MPGGPARVLDVGTRPFHAVDDPAVDDLAVDHLAVDDLAVDYLGFFGGASRGSKRTSRTMPTSSTSV